MFSVRIEVIIDLRTEKKDPNFETSSFRTNMSTRRSVYTELARSVFSPFCSYRYLLMICVVSVLPRLRSLDLH